MPPERPRIIFIAGVQEGVGTTTVSSIVSVLLR